MGTTSSTTAALSLTSGFEGINFNQQAAQSGYYMIPPDPIVAVGPTQVVTAVNDSINWYAKNGTAQKSQDMGSFVGASNARLFDPKLIYDTYAGRFVLVVMEQSGSPQVANIHLAISNDSNPNDGWTFQTINAKTTIKRKAYWADFPAVAADAAAIYITGNLF